MSAVRTGLLALLAGALLVGTLAAATLLPTAPEQPYSTTTEQL